MFSVDDPDNQHAGDLARLDAGELAQRFKALDRERRRIDAELAMLVAEVDRRGVYSVDGHASVRGWMRALGLWSTTDTNHTIRTAALITAAPQVADALATGVIGVAQVHRLGRAYANPRCGPQLAGVIEILVEHAATLPYDDFKLVVDRWETLADLDGAHRTAQHTHDQRAVTVGFIGDGFHLDTRGGAAQGAAMQEIFQRFLDAEFHTDWNHAKTIHGDATCHAHLARSDPQRRFDALYAIFLTAASTPNDAQAPEPLVNLVIDVATLDTLLTHLANLATGTAATLGSAFADLLDITPTDPTGTTTGAPSGTVLGIDTTTGRWADPRWRRTETTNGVPIPPADILTAILTGHTRRVLLDDTGVVTHLGRRRRLFTGGARHAVLLASPRCVWPGCTLPSGRCQTDHLTDWQHHGVTNPDNGAPLCPRHNRWKTHGYTITRQPNDTWHTHRPDHTEIA